MTQGAWFSHLLRHPARKWNKSILFFQPGAHNVPGCQCRWGQSDAM